jgi:hypothetical protein
VNPTTGHFIRVGPVKLLYPLIPLVSDLLADVHACPILAQLVVADERPLALLENDLSRSPIDKQHVRPFAACEPDDVKFPSPLQTRYEGANNLTVYLGEDVVLSGICKWDASLKRLQKRLCNRSPQYRRHAAADYR